MAGSSTFSFAFGFKIFYDFRSADAAVQTGIKNGENSIPLTSQPFDAKESSLSPTARKMQQRAREQAKERKIIEREADAESLWLLDAATAASSPAAKVKDKESLEILLVCTERLEKRRRSLFTPSRTSFWPPKPARHFKGMDGTPVSFEPSNSTSSDIRKKYEPRAENEFEEFLTKQSAARSVAEAKLEKKRSRNSFSALLESARTTDQDSVAIKPSVQSGSQAKSFFDLVAQVEKQDLEEEEALAIDVAHAMESPTPSPISSIKHLQKNSQVLSASREAYGGDLIDLSDHANAKSKTPSSLAERRDSDEGDQTIEHPTKEGVDDTSDDVAEEVRVEDTANDDEMCSEHSDSD